MQIESPYDAGATALDEYIGRFPEPVRDKLTRMRETIRAAAPAASERIAYGIPTFFLHGNLVHFAGYRNHIGFYPAASGVSAFAEELKPYKRAKGSVQFPLDQPLPVELIARIVRHRVEENTRQARHART